MQDQIPSAEHASELPPRPSITFGTITFSDGTKLSLDDDEIVVFVGPNNAGKSAALKELEISISNNVSQTVVTETTVRKVGNANTLLKWLEKNSLRVGQAGQHHFAGMGYTIHHAHAMFFDQPNRQPVASFFASRVGTDTRLIGSNPASGIKLYFDPPTHPIHLILEDDILAAKIGDLFTEAFSKDLVVFRAGGSSFPLLVGKKPATGGNLNELSKEYVTSLLAATSPLETQGDGMRSFATVLLHVLVADNYSVQFLDEPEAFLHPPQARLLGQFIAKERRANAQLFVATHSPEILEGILTGSSAKVRIVAFSEMGISIASKNSARKRPPQ